MYTLGQSVLADYVCVDTGSGVSSCVGTVANGSPIDTRSRGTHEFTVTSVDAAGNRNMRLVGYVVAPLGCSVQIGG